MCLDKASDEKIIGNNQSSSPMNNYLAIGMKVRRMSFPPRNVPLIEFYSMNDSTRAVSTMTADLSSNFSSRNQQFVVNTIAFMPTYVDSEI